MSEIVIVDDSEMNLVLLAEAVRTIPGTAVRTFIDAESALAALRQGADHLGVILTDYDMPGMDGIMLIRAVRSMAECCHVPMVMVTSMDQRRVRREALAAGATDFLAKPFDPVEIRARVTNLLALNTARLLEKDRSAWLEREVKAATATIEAREREIVIRLARAAEFRDSDTGDHVSRVATHARGIAEGLGCDPGWCTRIELASTMHDLGKIAVPDAILLKEGPLTAEERALICRHAEDGYRILEGSSSDVIQLAAEIALTHHERWDGTGYPHNLAGETIPLSGRIVAVADVFDALVSVRPYKRSWNLHEARSYLRANAGTQFDPCCVSAFLAATGS